MEKKLNLLLADLVVEYHKLQNFHWYIKGPAFFTLHAKLEELYNHIKDTVDEVAENILVIGGKPLGSLNEFLKHSKIKEEESKFVSGEYVLKSVEEDFSYILDEIKEIKKYADEENFYVISALMDDYIKNFGKTIWMLRQAQ